MGVRKVKGGNKYRLALSSVSAIDSLDDVGQIPSPFF